MQTGQHGVDVIPEAERTGRPRDIVSFLIASNVTLGVRGRLLGSAWACCSPSATPH
ncbi:hypothetical protein ACF1DY_15575 [Streptomyces albus]